LAGHAPETHALDEVEDSEAERDGVTLSFPRMIIAGLAIVLAVAIAEIVMATRWTPSSDGGAW